MGFIYRPVFILIAVLSLACIACQENEQIDSGVDPPNNTCIDYDNDGFGLYCEEGRDCDDLDDTVWEACEPNPDRCSMPRSGCPCEVEGQDIACLTPQPQVSEDGSELCYAGVRVCQDGAWTACENMEPYIPPNSDGPLPDDGAHRDALLDTDPTDNANGVCVGSCEAACRGYYDCPSGIDIPSFPASSNIRYDLELDYLAVTYNAALIIDDVNVLTGGYVRIFEAICPAGTSAYWWSIDPIIRFPDATEWSEVVITASTDDNQANLAACGMATTCGPTANVMDCDAVTCTLPVQPMERVNASDGNIANPPSWSGGPMNLRFDYLRVGFFFTVAAGRTLPPPRLEHYYVTYFCDPAS